jgi:hypothetical protein
VRVPYRSFGSAGVVVAAALLMAACGSSGAGSSSGTTHPEHTAASSTSASSTTAPPASSTSTTSTTGGAGSGPMVTASLPVVVCQTTSGVSTTTTSLPPSVSVSVPSSQAQQGNLAVYSDLTGRLMLVGPTVGWTCTGTFGADGSGMLALAPVGTTVPSAGTTWHLPASSLTQAIVAVESGGSTVQGAALACPLFSAAKAATQQDLGQGCAVTSPPQERVARTSAVQVGFQDPAGVAGVGSPSGGLNPANGVVLYQPKATEATAYQATCTLPAAQQDLCTAVLNQFATTFG